MTCQPPNPQPPANPRELWPIVLLIVLLLACGIVVMQIAQGPPDCALNHTGDGCREVGSP